MTILDQCVLRMLTARLTSADEGAGLFLRMWIDDAESHEPTWEARANGWRVDD